MDKEGRYLDGYLYFYECNFEKKDMLYIWVFLIVWVF